MTSFDVLGPLRVVGADGVEVSINGELQRRLLAALVLRRGRVVGSDALTEIVWSGLDTPKGNAPLQSLVFRARRHIPGLDIEHRGAGYVLRVDDAAVDVHRFERSIWEAVAQQGKSPAEAVAGLETALALWRGDPYEDLVDSDEARIETERLTELRRRASEERFDALVSLGAAADVLADLEAFVAAEPLREHPRRVLIDALAVTGRRAEALRVYDAYRRLLADELGVAPSVDLRRRHDELLVEDELPVLTASLFAPTRASAPVRRPTSSLIGRDAALDDLVGLVGRTRLVTLIGPGGVGKTRLSLEAAHRLADGFTDGVVFCDLTAAASGSSTGVPSVAGVVIAALGVESRADQDDLQRLSGVLRHDHTLLVLDNCEHVLDDAAALAEHVLGLTTDTVILATSRERLAVDGEHLFAVSPLAHDTGGGLSPARQLLVERTCAVTAFDPDSSESGLLDELCRRLDGLPLAIELAAARLQTLSVGDVIDGLDRSLAVLRGGRRTIERHRSVDAALQWSHDLLGDREREALRAAACFASSFDADDIAAVMDTDPVEARELLSLLVERSMASRDGARTFLLDIVRTFAREQFSSADQATLLPRFASRMLIVVTNLSDALRTATDDLPVREFTRRIADVRRAVAIALEGNDPGLALGIVVSLYEPSVNSLNPDLMRWGADAAVAGEKVAHPLTADGYAVAAMGAWKRGDLTEMRSLVARCESAATRLGIDDSYLVFGIPGVEDLAHGRLTSAIDRLHRSLACLASADDPLREADTRATIAICMAYAHDPTAVTMADQLVADLGDSVSAIARSWCWYAAGECRIDSEPGVASEHFERSIVAARHGGSPFVEGVAGASLASIHVRLGRVEAAIDTYRWLLPLWLRAGVRSPFWTAMRSVAELLGRGGEHEAAARVLGAVMSPSSGHEVFGDDAERLSTLRVALLGELGEHVFAERFASGSGLDDAAAAEVATAAFDRIG